MSKIEVLKIEVSALKDLDVDQEVTIPQNTVIGVIGINEDDGGSNATGKSSLAISIPLNLFGPKYIGVSAKDLKNRHLKSPVKTVGYYKLNDIDLKVTRVLGGELSFVYGDETPVTGAVDDVQEKLIATIGMTPNQILMLSYKDQKSPTRFLLMTDAEKKEFLSSFVDDSKFEGVYDTLLKEISTIKDSSIKKTATLEYLNNTNIPKLEQALVEKDREFNAFLSEYAAKNEKLDLEIASLEYESDNIALTDIEMMLSGNNEYQTLKKQYEKALNISTTKNVEAAIQIDAINQEIYAIEKEILNAGKVPDSLNLAVKSATDDLNTALSLRKKHEYNLRLLQVTLDEAEKLEESLNSPNKKICGHCNQELPEKDQETHLANLHKTLDVKKELLNTLFAECESNSDIDNRISSVESDVLAAKTAIAEFLAANSPAKLQEAVANKKKDIKAIELEKLLAQSSVNSLKNQISSIVNQTQRDIDNLKNSIYESIKNKKNEKQQLTYTYEKHVSTVNKSKLDFEAALLESSKISEEIVGLSRSLEVKIHTKDAVSKDGAIAYLFDEILEDLNAEINKNLKLFPNAQKFSLFFLPEKTTKSTGNVSKNITFTLFSGSEEINIKTTSGGEEMSILTAVDEALDTVLERRMGFFVGWKVLDEQMGFIDLNTKEAILDFYKEKSHNKSYIVIDHGSELNASFEDRITLRKKDKIARVET
ncbi:MAG TPA: hypothetical protein PKI14_05055 [Fervidobacterium sp.]|nr:hypothetical protein [Fervidobacterium sp.]